ncbi:MAG: sugar kinase [Candidatus Competibacteraceae bacterium]|nr:sugar kinase [Candidatus Competibacteraceae bacterium]
MSLLVVGTVALDSIETPFGKAERIIGGSATHFALAASFFCPDIRLVSVVGEDFPQNGLQQFARRNINTEGLQIKKGENSFFWAGRYHIDMNSRDTLDTQLNVLAGFDPIVPEASRNADFLMLGNLMPSLQRKVLQQMNQRPKLVMMDTMNFWMDTAWDDLMDMISRVDVLTINDEEARQLTKEYSLIKAARKIMQMGPRFLVIKKGENGALLFHENKLFFAPALPLEEVFDPTGAGDSFAGGFIGYLSGTNDLSFDNMKRAVIYGSAVASFCVEKFGIDRVADLHQNELDERVQEFIDLVQFDIDLV